MWDVEQTRCLEGTVRGMSAAAKTLRLYPPSSPMPRQAIDAALAPMHRFLATEPEMAFAVARDGFESGESKIGERVPGAAELSDRLRTHGVAEVRFLPSVDSEELLSFLVTTMDLPEDTRAAGGFATALAAKGVRSVGISEVSLTTADAPGPGDDEDEDEFLRGLAQDPDRLGAWIASAAKSDPAAFAEALGELTDAAGGAETPELLDTLTRAFSSLDPASKGALLELSIQRMDGREAVDGILGRVPPKELADGLTGGTRGDNLLSLSSAITSLPLGERLESVLAEIRASIAQGGYAEGEVHFFDRMVTLRASHSAELPLVQADASFAQTAHAVAVTEAELAESRAEVSAAPGHVDRQTVAAMLMLLDRQEDFAGYDRHLGRLSGMVPRLIESRDLDLAERVLTGLRDREASADRPWPELTNALRAAIASATSRRSTDGLLAAAMSDVALVAPARQVLACGGEPAQRALVEAAIAAGDARALDVAGELVGRRIGDYLAAAASQTPPDRVASIVQRLAALGDAKAEQAIENVLGRPDKQSRQAAAKGLAGGGPNAARHLVTLLHDQNQEVAIVAAHALGSTPAPTAAIALGNRLDGLAIDGKDFPIAREIIAALGRLGGREATEALERVASRRAFIKHAHFDEVRELARQALAAQARAGGVG